MPMYLPFQFSGIGSQTSKPMCESLVGVANPITRQKGTESFNPAREPKRPPVLGTSKSGGVLIDVAEEIVTFAMLTDARLSHDCCAETRAGTKASAANKTAKDACRHFIGIPPAVPISVADYTPGLSHHILFLSRISKDLSGINGNERWSSYVSVLDRRNFSAIIRSAATFLQWGNYS